MSASTIARESPTVEGRHRHFVVASERGHEEPQKDTTSRHERSQCRHILREVFPTSGRSTLTNGDDP
jgi:arylamine N-acetyltransferase